MEQHAFALRIATGKESELQELERQLATTRAAEMADLRRRYGVKRELAYLQREPRKPSLYILYQEGSDIEAAFERLLGSKHPFDQWLASNLSKVLIFEADQRLPRSRLILDSWAQGLPRDLHMFAVAIAPGQLEGWLLFTDDLNGPKRREYQESRRRIGYGERVFLQQSPTADMVIPCIRGKDPERDTEQLSGSEHPFERWFTAEISKYHDMDFNQPLPWESERIRGWGVELPITV